MNHIWDDWDNLEQYQNKLDIIIGNDEIFIYFNEWISQGSFYDFCINVLKCEYKQREWEVLQSITNSCGIIFPFEKLVIICVSEAPPKEVRPTKISFDNDYRLYAEAEPAIQYADGYSLYSYHGVNLPEKYGKVHLSQWQAKWLLTEENAELRRVLTQAIGYSRICHASFAGSTATPQTRSRVASN